METTQIWDNPKVHVGSDIYLRTPWYYTVDFNGGVLMAFL